MPLALAFLTLLASITLTCLFCVRPMRTGRGCAKPQRPALSRTAPPDASAPKTYRPPATTSQP
jgi:hypothetical protein